MWTILRSVYSIYYKSAYIFFLHVYIWQCVQFSHFDSSKLRAISGNQNKKIYNTSNNSNNPNIYIFPLSLSVQFLANVITFYKTKQKNTIANKPNQPTSKCILLHAIITKEWKIYLLFYHFTFYTHTYAHTQLLMWLQCTVINSHDICSQHWNVYLIPHYIKRWYFVVDEKFSFAVVLKTKSAWHTSKLNERIMKQTATTTTTNDIIH